MASFITISYKRLSDLFIELFSSLTQYSLFLRRLYFVHTAVRWYMHTQHKPSQVERKRKMAVKRKEPKPKKSPIRGALDMILFVGWIIGTGFGGYFLGMSQRNQMIENTPPVECPKPERIVQPREHKLEIPTELDCSAYLSTTKAGTDYEYLKKSWTCSRAKYNNSLQHELKNVNLAKTKWKNILSVDPDHFFNKYLSQYPGDMVVTQPVLIFSHAPVQTLEDVAEKCTVMDVAIVPDRPGMCVAVTETYHDVASYHLLHAKQSPDGTLALTPNPVRGRNLPTETSYSSARQLLLDYFTFASAVSGATRGLVLKAGPRKLSAVACIIEHKSEIELFRNSLQSYFAAGGAKEHIFTVTRHPHFTKELKALGIKSIYANKATSVGKDLPAHISRSFMQIWFAFAAAEAGANVLWISPATIWKGEHSSLMNSIAKDVETAWMFNGRKDPRAAPFFISTDFFFVRGGIGEDRSIHLMHEILVHADLLVEWDNLNALAAYRLTENNARYVTQINISFLTSSFPQIWDDKCYFPTITSPEYTTFGK
jgi:hypothetical protein